MTRALNNIEIDFSRLIFTGNKKSLEKQLNANCEIGKSHGMMEHLIAEKGGCNDGLLSRPSHSEYIIGVVGTNFQFKMKYFTAILVYEY